MAIGVSFLPGSNGQGQRNNNESGPVTPVQQAIKTLSLRLPRILGAGSFAPEALLNSGGAASMAADGLSGAGMNVDRLVQSILAQLPIGNASQAPAQMRGMGAAPSSPAPSIPAPRVYGTEPNSPNVPTSPVDPLPTTPDVKPPIEPWGRGPNIPVDRGFGQRRR